MNQVQRNLQYVQQEGSPLFRTLSNFVKITCICVTAGYLLSFLSATIELMAVTPGYLMPPHFSIWTLGTFFLIECHIWEVLVDILTLGLCAKLIEPLWGQLEMLMFFVICNLCSVVLTTVCYLFLYMCTKNSEVLFDIKIYGLSGYVAGVCVAVQQIMPDHPVINTPLGTFTNRNIPLTVLILFAILWLVGLVEGMYPLMFGNGIIVSWVYLRFWQHHSNARRGDLSESFQFEKFFPTVLQPIVKILVNLLYIVGLKGNCRDAKKQQESLLPTTTSSSRMSLDQQLSDMDYVDVERRRQIALKALNERLSSQKNRQQKAKTSTSPTPGPSSASSSSPASILPPSTTTKPFTTPSTTIPNSGQ